MLGSKKMCYLAKIIGVAFDHIFFNKWAKGVFCLGTIRIILQNNNSKKLLWAFFLIFEKHLLVYFLSIILWCSIGTRIGKGYIDYRYQTWVPIFVSVVILFSLPVNPCWKCYLKGKNDQWFLASWDVRGRLEQPKIQ